MHLLAFDNCAELGCWAADLQKLGLLTWHKLTTAGLAARENLDL